MITISVCIPTCDRPDLLRQAVDSCSRQTLLPNEIVIGDDSNGDATERLAAELQQHSAVPIHYQHNRPRHGQAANINGLYNQVSSSHLVLLHDDDLLLPNALSDLAGCWDRHPNLTAAYGKQQVISDDGTLCLEQSEQLNRAYFRTSEYEGLQRFNWFPGVAQQFPNDGFMLTTEAARAISWRSREEVGDGCEFDFSLRLCLQYENFYFLNKYTAAYRLTDVCMSKSLDFDGVLQSYRILSKARLPAEAETIRRKRLQEMASHAILEASYMGNRKEAWKIYWGPFYPWRARLSPGGFRRLGQCALPREVVRFVHDKITETGR